MFNNVLRSYLLVLVMVLGGGALIVQLFGALMTSKQDRLKADVPTTGSSPYPFRTGWALLLLAGNLLVAAYYFGILK